MKKLILIISFFPLFTFGQERLVNELIFDKGFHQCLDNWVVYDKSGSKYRYGYIYSDSESFESYFAGTFKIKNDGTIKNHHADTTYIISSQILGEYPSGTLAIMSSELREVLNPWLPSYIIRFQNSLDTVQKLTLTGYNFNHIRLSEYAIPYLEHAFNLNSKSNKVTFELSYALNATKRYKEALEILRSAILKDSVSGLLFRELGYTYIKLNQLDSAELIYNQGIQISTENSEKSEMAINMAQAYFEINNKTKFDEWAAITREYVEPNSRFLNYLEEFEKQLEK